MTIARITPVRAGLPPSAGGDRHGAPTGSPNERAEAARETNPPLTSRSMPAGGRDDSRVSARERYELRCGDCGYGAIAAHTPPHCPMCGAQRWLPLPQRLHATSARPLPQTTRHPASITNSPSRGPGRTRSERARFQAAP